MPVCVCVCECVCVRACMPLLSDECEKFKVFCTCIAAQDRAPSSQSEVHQAWPRPPLLPPCPYCSNAVASPLAG